MRRPICSSGTSCRCRKKIDLRLVLATPSLVRLPKIASGEDLKEDTSTWKRLPAGKIAMAFPVGNPRVWEAASKPMM